MTAPTMALTNRKYLERSGELGKRWKNGDSAHFIGSRLRHVVCSFWLMTPNRGFKGERIFWMMVKIRKCVLFVRFLFFISLLGGCFLTRWKTAKNMNKLWSLKLCRDTILIHRCYFRISSRLEDMCFFAFCSSFFPRSRKIIFRASIYLFLPSIPAKSKAGYSSGNPI